MKRNKLFYKVAVVLLFSFWVINGTACKKDAGVKPQKEFTAAVKFAYGEDKIYRSYEREINGVKDYELAALGEVLFFA